MEIRKRGGGYVEVGRRTRSQAIKDHCTECMGHGEEHPKDCPDTHCSLYPYRGKSMVAYGGGV